MAILGDDMSLGSDDNVRVFCRVRPPNERELSVGYRRVTEVSENKKTVTLQSRPTPKVFTFDYVAGEDSTQEEVFNVVGRPVTQACLKGYNGTIFAYGQTGSGKTFTVLGPDVDSMYNEEDTAETSLEIRGLVPRVLEYLFAHISREKRGNSTTEFLCRCSFLEIYNERIYDLLDTATTDAGLQLRESMNTGVYVEGLTEISVSDAQEAGALIALGARNRRVGETAMNRESSRSHSVFTLMIEAKETFEGLTKSRFAKFNLIDLAGSERQRATEAAGERLKEAGSINKSLSALGNVINALVDQAAGKTRHVHYRDSKLTFLLKDSLGGNSKTFIISTITPAGDCFGETLSTLKFAQRAKMVKNNAIVNENTVGSVIQLQKEVRSLQEEITKLRAQKPPEKSLYALQVLQQSPEYSEDKSARELLIHALVAKENKARENEYLRTSLKNLKFVCSTSERQIQNQRMMLKLRSEAVNRLQCRIQATSSKQTSGQSSESLLPRTSMSNLRPPKPVLQNSKPGFPVEEREALMLENRLLKDEALTSVQAVRWRMRYEETLESLQQANEEVQYLQDRLRELDEDFEDAEGRSEVVRLREANDAISRELSIMLVENTELQEKLRPYVNGHPNSKDVTGSADLHIEVSKWRQALEFDRIIAEQASRRSEAEREASDARKELRSLQKRFDEVQSQREGELRDMEERMKTLSQACDKANEASAREVDLQTKLSLSCSDNAALIQRVETMQSEIEEAHREAKEAWQAVKDKEKELRENHESMMLKQQEEIAKERKSFSEKLSKLEEDLDYWKTQSEDSSKKIAALESDAVRMENEVSSVNRKNQALSFELENLQEDHDTLTEQVRFYMDTCTRVDAEKSELTDAIRQLNEIKTKLEGKIEEQKERMAIAEKEEGRQLAIAKSEAAAVRSELERLEGKLNEYNGELADKTARLQETEKALASAAGKEHEQSMVITDLNGKIQALRSDLAEATSKLDNKGVEIASLTEELSVARTALGETVQKLHAADASHGAERDQWEETARRRDQEIATLQEEIREKSAGYELSLRESEEIQQNLKQQLEEVIADKSAVIADLERALQHSQEQSKALEDSVEALEQQKNALSLDLEKEQRTMKVRSEELRKEIEELKSEAEVLDKRLAEALDEKSILVKEMRDLSIKAREREEELERKLGDEAERFRSTQESLELEIEKLKKANQANKASFEAQRQADSERSQKLEDDLECAFKEKKMMNEQIVDLQNSVSEARQASETEIAGLKETLSVLKSEAHDKELARQEELNNLERTLSSKLTELQNLQSEYQSLQLALEKNETVVKEKEILCERQAEKIDVLMKQREEAENLLSEVQHKFVATSAALTEKSEEVELYRKRAQQLNEVESLNKSLLDEKSSLLTEKETLTLSLAERSEKVLNLTDEIREISRKAEDSSASFSAKVDALETNTLRLENALHDKDAKITELNVQVQELNKALEEKITDVEALESKLKEKTRVLLYKEDEWRKLEAEMKSVKDLQAECKELRRQLGEKEEAMKIIKEENEKLVGHQNFKQKIQHHVKIKEENNELQQKTKELSEENFALRRRLATLLASKENAKPRDRNVAAARAALENSTEKRPGGPNTRSRTQVEP